MADENIPQDGPQISVNADEFPALARSLQFGTDIDGYLTSLGVDVSQLQDDGDQGADDRANVG